MKLNGTTKTTANKQFTLNIANPNGLCMGTLVAVDVTPMQTIKDTSGWVSFRGLNPFSLNFHFTQINKDVNEEAGTYTYRINPIDYSANGRHDLGENSIVGYIGHFIEVFTGKTLVENKTNFTLVDANGKEISTENGASYKGEDLIAAFKKFFDEVAFFFNGGKDGKAIFADKKLWIKLLLYDAKGPVNNSNPGFPQYVNDGVIELYKENIKPTIRVKIEKGEDNKPRAKTSVTSQMPGATNMQQPNFLGNPAISDF